MIARLTARPTSARRPIQRATTSTTTTNSAASHSNGVVRWYSTKLYWNSSGASRLYSSTTRSPTSKVGALKSICELRKVARSLSSGPEVRRTVTLWQSVSSCSSTSVHEVVSTSVTVAST